MKILVVDNNKMDFTKIDKVYPHETIKIINVKTKDQIIEKMNNEPDINLVIINEVISDVLKKHLTYKEIRQININVPIISLTIA